MLNNHLHLVFLIFFSNDLLAVNINCNKGIVKTTKKYKILTRKIEICFIQNKYYVSKNCRNKSCLALSKKKFIPFNKSSTSSHAATLCKLHNGDYRAIDLKLNNKILKYDKCTFKDNSFVSTNYLVNNNDPKKAKIKP